MFLRFKWKLKCAEARYLLCDRNVMSLSRLQSFEVLGKLLDENSDHVLKYLIFSNYS